MMIASVAVGVDLELEVSGFTTAEMRTPLVELNCALFDRPLNITTPQALELAAALVIAAGRANSAG